MLFVANNLSLASLLPRLFISMAIVIGVMWIAARIMKNRQVPGSRAVRLGSSSLSSKKRMPIVQVMARQAVGRNSSVTVIRMGDKALVLGVTETNVTLLTEVSARSLEEDEGHRVSVSGTGVTDVTESHGTGTPLDAVASGSTRKGLLEQVRELTVRKV